MNFVTDVGTLIQATCFKAAYKFGRMGSNISRLFAKKWREAVVNVCSRNALVPNPSLPIRTLVLFLSPRNSISRNRNPPNLTKIRFRLLVDHFN